MGNLFKVVIVFFGLKEVDGIEYIEVDINGFLEGDIKDYFDVNYKCKELDFLIFKYVD